MAVGNQTGITILPGSGDGTFRKTPTISVDHAPQALVVGDFNGDRKLDLAASNYLAKDVTVLLGNGDGTFTLRTVAGASGNSLAVGDFDGNRRLDLAASAKFNYEQSREILLGNGAGGFTLSALERSRNSGRSGRGGFHRRWLVRSGRR